MEVTYTCLNCGVTFKIEQGSRRRYCDSCVIKKMFDRHYLQGKCAMCGKEGNVVRHHQTYDMLRDMKSPKGKVIIICLSCHRKIHSKYPKRNKLSNSES